MEKFFIYHKKGKKIGCTNNLKRRVEFEQKILDYEILEVHTDIFLASKREKELQREYGYRVDGAPYYVQYFRSKKRTREGILAAAKKQAIAKKGKRQKHLEHPVEQFTKEGKFVKRYPSIGRAAKALNCDPTNIWACLTKDYRKSAMGYKWQYAT